MGGIRRRRERTQERWRPPELRAWVLPWWVRQQIDPIGPAPDPGVLGRAGRAWTPLGLPDDDARWSVDASGTIAPALTAWSIEWWVGADDRWHVPSGEAAVRQRLVGAAPVVETRLRVPGGDVVATHWAVPAPPGPPVVCLDLSNPGAAAVAIAVALRPWGRLGLGSLHRVGLQAGELTVEGQAILRAEIPPRQAAFSDGRGGDVAAVVMANGATAATDLLLADTVLVDPAGWATAALIWPLAPRAAIRVEIRAGASAPGRPGPRHRGGASEGPAAQAPSEPSPESRPKRPSADEVAHGWTARVERATRLGLPSDPLGTAIDVARRRLLLAAGGPASTAGSSGPRQGALVVAALASAGCRDEAATRLEGWRPDRRHGAEPTALASTLWAIGRWAATGPDPDGLIPRSALVVAEAAEILGQARRRGGPTSAPGALTDIAWTVAGLRSAAALLASLDEGRSASAVARWADARVGELTEGLLAVAGPDGGADTHQEGRAAAEDDAIGAGLLAVHLGVLDAHHPGAVTARRAATARAGAGGVAVGPGGDLSPHLTLLLALSSVLGGEDPSGPLAWTLSAASPTWTWPPLVEVPVIAHGPSGADDPLVSAAWWALGRALLVDDHATATPPGDGPGPARIEGDRCVELALFPWIPDDWWGRDLEVHGLATAAGRASWALRWHGRRPALLWELEGQGPDVTWRAPGIDRAWSATGRRGEALIGSDGGADPG